MNEGKNSENRHVRDCTTDRHSRPHARRAVPGCGHLQSERLFLLPLGISRRWQLLGAEDISRVADHLRLCVLQLCDLAIAAPAAQRAAAPADGHLRLVAVGLGRARSVGLAAAHARAGSRPCRAARYWRELLADPLSPQRPARLADDHLIMAID